ncbi:TetR/AcrR family transcriptional regulator [Methylobacterium sp. Leaf118]|uniref:TetR/AcrR family transcriptional regulator n=1 Tax=Methylobacterium sp. Leaf118 TaxID=2876562 RepID=UPI001E36C88E|nr:TetR/AcrR family transcriptional regulator [Methylobacterium sp. Leaf118]
MRITKEQKDANRERILSTAALLFRERGFDGVGVAELMERAGFTHGGFYNHFRSKDELIAQACAHGFAENERRRAGYDIETILGAYLSRRHRDAPGQGCLTAALGSEAARQSDATRAAFAAWADDTVRRLAGHLSPDPEGDPAARAAAIGILAQAVGALTLSRACPDTAPIADEILEACRAACIEAVQRGRAAPKRRRRTPEEPR